MVLIVYSLCFRALIIFPKFRSDNECAKLLRVVLRDENCFNIDFLLISPKKSTALLKYLYSKLKLSILSIRKYLEQLSL